MAVSPSEETLVVVTDASQLYQITMSTAELGKVGLWCESAKMAACVCVGVED